MHLQKEKSLLGAWLIEGKAESPPRRLLTFVFDNTGKAQANEQRYSKLKGKYSELVQSHADLLRKVRPACPLCLAQALPLRADPVPPSISGRSPQFLGAMASQDPSPSLS